MTKKYRSSIEKHNAPERGVSSRSDLINFDLATLHDVLEITQLSGGHPSKRGHKQFISDNLTAIYTGKAQATSTIPSAGVLVSSIGQVHELSDLTKWSKESGANVVKQGYSYTLSSNGNLAQPRLEGLVTVNPGDILSIRFKLTKSKGQGMTVAIGALGFDNDGDSLDVYNLDTIQTSQYLIKRLYCDSRQDVRLVIYVGYTHPQGQQIEWTASDFSVEYLKEVSVGLSGLENQTKVDLNIAERDVLFLEERLNTQKGGRL